MVLRQLPGHVTQGRGLCAASVLPLVLGTLPVPRACPAPGIAGGEEVMMQGHNYCPLLLKELVQRRSVLCLLLLLLKYVRCRLAPSPSLGFHILLSHHIVVTWQFLTPSDAQGHALLAEFPVLIQFIFPFSVQPLGQKLLCSSATSFAFPVILFIFICFPLLYVFSCLLVGSITGQEAARHFYHPHASNWDLPGSVGHCVCPRTSWEFNDSNCRDAGHGHSLSHAHLFFWCSVVLCLLESLQRRV